MQFPDYSSFQDVSIVRVYCQRVLPMLLLSSERSLVRDVPRLEGYLSERSWFRKGRRSPIRDPLPKALTSKMLADQEVPWLPSWARLPFAIYKEIERQAKPGAKPSEAASSLKGPWLSEVHGCLSMTSGFPSLEVLRFGGIILTEFLGVVHHLLLLWFRVSDNISYRKALEEWEYRSFASIYRV